MISRLKKVILRAHDRITESEDTRRWREHQRAAAPARYYGNGGTIHATNTIDIVIEKGQVTEVWFRCQQLPFQVSSPKGHALYGARSEHLPLLTGVEVIDQ